MLEMRPQALIKPLGHAAIAHVAHQHDEGFGVALGDFGVGPVVARQIFKGALQRVEDRPVARQIELVVKQLAVVEGGRHVVIEAGLRQPVKRFAVVGLVSCRLHALA